MNSSSFDAFGFVAGLEFFGIKLGLDQTREVFARLGNPEKSLRFLHIAGSNGKGSVSALLDGALRQTGYHVGFYSSPHLVKVNERFRIDGEPVSDGEFTAAAEQLYPVVQAMAQEGKKVTYFEATTAIAALLFAKNKVDYVVWEVGMGGRLDATNIITPEVSVITGISLEHSQYLGNTLGKIAFEKAGIIKPGIPVFCGITTPDEAVAVIRARAAELGAPFILSNAPDHSSARFDAAPDGHAAWQTFRLKETGETLRVQLMGTYQRGNAALACTVLHYLAQKDGFDYGKAVEGFSAVTWPARFQFFPEKHLLMDAAHNPEGVESLRDSLKELYPDKKFHFIFGAFSDKDTAPSIAMLAPLAKSFRFIHMDTMRASKTAADLAQELASVAPQIPSSASSLEAALAAPEDPSVLCGSLHLCGDALAILQKN